MALEKNDLQAIEKIVEKSEKRLEQKLEKKISESENRVISTITREVIDLGEINRAVIDRVDHISAIEKDIVRIKAKIGMN